MHFSLNLPSVRSGGAHLHIVCAAEAVIVGQGAGSRGIFVEPERDLRLD